MEDEEEIVNGPTAESSDIARYQAAHHRFTKEMEDAGVKELWFEHYW